MLEGGEQAGVSTGEAGGRWEVLTLVKGQVVFLEEMPVGKSPKGRGGLCSSPGQGKWGLGEDTPATEEQGGPEALSGAWPQPPRLFCPSQGGRAWGEKARRTGGC